MVALGALAGLLAGCSTSATYVGSASQEMFYKLPNGWKVYNEATLIRRGDIKSPGPLFESIDTADPTIDPATLPVPSSKPWAVAMVRTLSPTEQQQLSLQSLDDLLIPVDQLNQELQGSVTEIAQPQLLVHGALHGTRVAFQVPTPNGDVSFVQSALVNSPTTEVWALLVGCSSACFNANQSEINNIMNSWTVMNKGTS